MTGAGFFMRYICTTRRDENDDLMTIDDHICGHIVDNSLVVRSARRRRVGAKEQAVV